MNTLQNTMDYDDEIINLTATSCHVDQSQHYLVCITIHKASNLATFNADSYVTIILNGRTKTTATYRNSDCPFFNEYFVFEVFGTLHELLRMTAFITIFKKRWCAKRDEIIGELIIDLNTVWNMENHCFYKKWARLESPPLDSSTTVRDCNYGHLQMDMSIISRNERPIPAVISTHDYDSIENNLLEPHDPDQISHKFQYLVKIYKGVFQWKNNTLIRVNFAGSSCKTKSVSSVYNVFEWNEQLCFYWFYPSLCQTFLIQVMSSECFKWESMCDVEIHFNEISQSLNELINFPSIGPTYIHLYSNTDKNEYLGKLLLTIESNESDGIVKNRKPSITALPTLHEPDYWDIDNFHINIIIYGLYRLDANTNKIKLFARFADKRSDDFELSVQPFGPIKSKAHFYYSNQSINLPDLRIKIRMADVRRKYNIDMHLDNIITELLKYLDNFHQIEVNQNGLKFRIKFLKRIINRFYTNLQTLSDNVYNTMFKKTTQWDKGRMSLTKILIENILIQLNEHRNALKRHKKIVGDLNFDDLIKSLMTIAQNLRAIVNNRVQDKWPTLILCSASGSQITSTFRTDPMVYFNLSNPSDMGRLCNARHTVMFKPTSCNHSCQSCGCIYMIANLSIWIGTGQEQNEWIPPDCKSTPNTNFELNDSSCYFECNIYIHQAKIRPGHDLNGLADPKIIVSLEQLQASTSVINETLSPVWNEIIKFPCISWNGGSRWLYFNSPILALDLYDVDAKKKTEELIGSATLIPNVKLLPTTLDSIAEPDFEKKQKKSKTKSVTFDENAENCKAKVQSTIVQIDIDSENVTDSGSSTNHSVPDPSSTSIMIPIKDRIKIGKNPINLIKKKFKQPVNLSRQSFPPPLRWVNICKNGEMVAEVLISAELLETEDKTEFQADEPFTVTKNLPPEICPIMSYYEVEVMFAGLRHANKLPGRTIGKYKIELNFGELTLKSGLSTKKFGESVNLFDPFRSGFVSLPNQHNYWPPLILKQLDCIGKKDVTIGAAIILRPEQFFVESMPMELENEIMDELTIDSTDCEEHYGDKIIPSEVKKPSKKNSIRNKFWEYSPKNLLKLIQSKKSKEKPSLKRRNSIDVEYTWWTKFYNSFVYQLDNPDQLHTKHSLRIFDTELENQKEFEYLVDWARPIGLVRGLQSCKKSNNQRSVKEQYCVLKYCVHVRNYTEKDDGVGDNRRAKGNVVFGPKDRFQQISNLIDETKIVLRIYVVQGINLRSQDVYGYSDSYIKLEYANEKITDRAHFIPNQANPIFGRRYQMNGILPKDLELKISVYDRDEGCCSDDLIGYTIIDVENRLRTKYRTTCGIPYEYSKYGYNSWRDSNLPSEILKNFCKRYNLKPPVLVGRNQMQVAGITFDDLTQISVAEEPLERLSLSVLRQLDRIPSIGYNLIPEHVETRSLFRQDRPGVEQGKLQMWLEVYDTKLIPTPIDITPTPSRYYELRVIVWNTADVILNDENIFGKNMSDIYVRGWLDDADHYQATDVHYRSLNGEGNFNWRMVFPLKYSKVEDMMIITKKKSIYEKYDTEEKVPARLHLQVWDNDAISADDFLGSLSIKLSYFPEPAPTAPKCILVKDSKKLKKKLFINLFNSQPVRGWFPFEGEMKDGKAGQTGKVELELEVLLQEDAQLNPVGLGRNSPNALSPPNRPETSFKWFSNPFLSLKHIIGPQLKKCCIYICIFLIILPLIIFIIYKLIESGKLKNFGMKRLTDTDFNNF